MAKSWEPDSYPVRTPTMLDQKNGRTVNPPRTQRLGGRGESRELKLEKLIGDEGPVGNRPVSDRGRGGRK